MVKEGQSFDLKYENIMPVCAGHVLRLDRLDRGRQDGSLELQHSVAHVHFAHVAKVMGALIPVGCQEGHKWKFWLWKALFVACQSHYISI